MKVSEVRIIPVKSGNGSTKAYASINLDGVFAVNDIRVVEGKKGLFISLPNRKGWIDDGFSHELIMEALKEAIYNGVTSLRYIEKILYEWRKKGYKNKKDIQEAKEKYRESKKETKDYFFYDWINDD